MTRPRIVSVMNDETYDLVMSPQAEATLARFADFDRHRGASNLDEDGLIRILRGADGALASWGVRWTERAIRETELKIIGHAAGTVRGCRCWSGSAASPSHAAPVIVRASSTGRAFRKLLRAFDDVEVRVTDPYLSLDGARELDVRIAPLEELPEECDAGPGARSSGTTGPGFWRRIYSRSRA